MKITEDMKERVMDDEKERDSSNGNWVEEFYRWMGELIRENKEEG